MLYFKSASGAVFAYGTESEREKFGSPDLVEMTQEEINAHLNPSPSYQQELAELNASWQQQVDGYNRAFAVAALSDGPQEESKKLAIRADYEAARQKNAEDRAALKTKYGM